MAGKPRKAKTPHTSVVRNRKITSALGDRDADVPSSMSPFIPVAKTRGSGLDPGDGRGSKAVTGRRYDRDRLGRFD